MQLQIETISICDAACVFCNYPTMTRQRGTMGMELYRKIIDEAATLPLIEQVCLTGLGEPLLDRQVLERIRYARQKLPLIELVLFSNGSRFSVDLAWKLQRAGLNTIYISLNAVNARQRSQIMKLDDYDCLVPKIHQAIAELQGKMRIVVKGIVSTDLMEGGDQEDFLRTWGDWQKGGVGLLHLEGNWAGAVWPMRTLPTKACSRALGQIMVLWDGRVSLCCFDGDGKVILGDVSKQTIREVFNGEKALGVRTAHNEGRRGELELCRECTAI